MEKELKRRNGLPGISIEELEGIQSRAEQLARELRNCRNELCSHCGRYVDAHMGSCDHCRYRAGGDWEEATA